MAGGNTIGRIVGQSPAKNSKPSEGNPLQKFMDLVKQAMDMYKQISELVKSFSGGGGGAGGGAAGAAAGGGAAGGGAAGGPAALLGPLQQAMGLASQLTGLNSAITDALGASAANPAGGASPTASTLGTAPTGAAPTGPAPTSTSPSFDPARLRDLFAANPTLADQAASTRLALRDTLTGIGPLLSPTPASMEGPASPDRAQTRDIQDALHTITMNLSGPPGSAVEQSRLDAALPIAQQLASSAPTPAQGAQAVDNAMTSAAMAGASKPALAMLQQVMGQIQQVMGLVQQVMGMVKKLQGDGAQIKRKE